MQKLKKSHNDDMAFWDNVAFELDCLGMTNKALAEQVGITASNIGKGIRLGSSPSAETAVKIAKVLGVSVEYLVNGTDSEKTSSSQSDTRLSPKYHKYAKVLDALISLPEHEREPIIQMISNMSAIKK